MEDLALDNPLVQCVKCKTVQRLLSRQYLPDLNRPGRLHRVCRVCGDDTYVEMPKIEVPRR